MNMWNADSSMQQEQATYQILLLDLSRNIEDHNWLINKDSTSLQRIIHRRPSYTSIICSIYVYKLINNLSEQY
jgi:hypothetical protein